MVQGLKRAVNKEAGAGELRGALGVLAEPGQLTSRFSLQTSGHQVKTVHEPEEKGQSTEADELPRETRG